MKAVSCQANRFGRDVENKADNLGDDAEDAAEDVQRQGKSLNLLHLLLMLLDVMLLHLSC